jgi:predicted metal-binding protein
MRLLMVWKNWLRNYILSLRVGVKSGRPCKHPFKARPSMEAVGIDVYLTAQKAGLGFFYGIEDEVVWNGLVLLE